MEGTVYFFTGLSGAGKTTIGGLFYQRLHERKPDAVLLDGDVVRKMLTSGGPLPFSVEASQALQRAASEAKDYSYEGRLKGAWMLFRLCKELAEQGRDVVCCSICMYSAVRQWNRENILNYREIYIKVSWETLYQRDQKGLYSSGIKNVVGVDIPAEEPEYPDVVIQNDGGETPEQIVSRLETQLGMPCKERSLNVKTGYDCIPVMRVCYDALYDELSKELFFARLKTDIDPSAEHIQELAALSGHGKEQLLDQLPWLLELAENQTPVYLYGAGIFGVWWGEMLKGLHVNVRAFFDRRYEILQTRVGLPVLQPPVYQKNWDQIMEPNAKIMVTATLHEDEIVSLLKEAGFPQERLLPQTRDYIVDIMHQYFDFMEHVPADGAFVDCGCFDLDTSTRFAALRGNPSTRIIAFEPDPDNYEKCNRKIEEQHLTNVNLIQAGLWNETTTLRFHAGGVGTSFLSNDGEIAVPVVTLDSIVKDEPVAFIKMDIEGSEMQALRGAANIIRRDKPLCAICIYHKPGDMLEISSYLKQLVPEYQFAIRHYAVTADETVLYAFV